MKNIAHIQTILYINIQPKQIVLIFILLVQDTAIIHIFTKVCTIEKGCEIKHVLEIKIITEKWDSKTPSVGTILPYLETTA